MDDYPARVAELLETVAKRVRSMTVDRAAGWIKWATLGILLVTLAGAAFVLLLIGLIRLLGELIGYEPAYAAIAGIFALAGLFLWSKRRPRTAD